MAKKDKSQVSRGRKEPKLPNSVEEFPLLDKLGLYAANTVGDGNCLFRSLSDQRYGDQSRYAEIRQEVVKYIRTHPDRFAAFVGEFGETFDQYVARIEQDAVYGGHLEIVAFVEAFRTEVCIYQADLLYVVRPSNFPLAKIHVAYHSWEHYSSVRNKAGPHTGLPQVQPDESQATTSAVANEGVAGWMVDIVLRSVPDVSEEKVTEMLRTKDYNDVIETLLLDDIDSTGQAPDETSTTQAAEPIEQSVPTSAPDLASELVEPPAKTVYAKRISGREKRAERKQRLQRKRRASVQADNPPDHNPVVNPLYI